MNDCLLGIWVKVQNLLMREDGQDLVEYALAFTMIALATTASMNSLATGINNEFTHVSSTLTSYV